MVEDLPLEVLSLVFDMLPWHDRLNCSEVSWRWHRAVNSQDFLLRTAITLQTVSEVAFLSRNYKHLIIASEIESFDSDDADQDTKNIITEALLDIFKSRGQNVLTLEMDVEAMDVPGLGEMFARLPNLEQLHLTSYCLQTSSPPIPFPLASLRKIKFRTVQSGEKDFAVFCGYFSNTPLLSVLCLNNFSHEADLDDLIAFLRGHSHITSFHVPCFWDDAKSILVWSVLSPKLTGLHFSEHYYEVDDGEYIPAETMVEVMCNRFTNLRYLDLSGLADHLNRDKYEPIFRSQLIKFKNLTHLKLRGLVTSFVLPLLPSMGLNLVSLHIVPCDGGLKELPMLENLGVVLTNVKQLNLDLFLVSPTTLVNPDVNFDAILQHFPCLTHLHLLIQSIDESPATSDKVLLAIVNKCPGLIDLSLHFETDQKETSQICIINGLVNLRVLKLKSNLRWNCFNLKLPSLKEIKIMPLGRHSLGLNFFTIADAETLIRNCPKLSFIFTDQMDDKMIGNCIVTSCLSSKYKWREDTFFPQKMTCSCL